MNKKKTCCFFGHRKINVTDELVKHLKDIIENLITVEKVDTFLFGSKSEFYELCLKIVTGLKEKHPHIKRIYVRAEFPCINDDYRAYLLENYENTYYPERIVNAGRAVYVERNYEMIDSSGYCVIYYDEGYTPPERKSERWNLSSCQSKSGTRLAYDYAKRKNVKIIKTP